MKKTEYTFQCFKTNDEILSLKKSWEELHNNCTVQSVYNSFSFIYESIRTFQNSEITKKIFTLTDSSSGQLIAIFPFQKRKTAWKLIPYNTYETTAINEIMDKPFPLIREGFHDSAWINFIAHLKANVSDWDHLFLRDVPSSYPVLSLLPEICKDIGVLYSAEYDCISTEIDIQGTWEEFWGKHKTMRRNIRKLEKNFGDRLSFNVYKDSWKKHLDEYIALERKSWKNGLGVTKDDQTITFYNRFCKHLDSTGDLMFGFLTVDSQVIAGTILYTNNDTVYFPQGCYDPQYKKYSPNMVNISLLLKHLFETNYKNADFLCGYADFVNKWTDTEIKTYDVNIYNNRLAVRMILVGKHLINSLLHLKKNLKITYSNFMANDKQEIQRK